MRTKRQNAILQLINERPVETQAELTEALAQMGFEVTQATVSRDIKELRLIKAISASGRSVYTRGRQAQEDSLNSRLALIFEKCVADVDYAVNIVVIKTPTGLAQSACAALDSMNLSEVVGTVAGDDTVFLAVRSEETARELAKKLRHLAGI